MSELALELVRKCLESKDPYLDLGRCGLTALNFRENSPLDNALRQCTHIKTFILGNFWYNLEKEETEHSQNTEEDNFFNRLPKAVLTLKQITTLIISGGATKPWGIDDMSFVSNFINLRVLSISSNKIKKITGLENLTELRHLDLGGNQLKVLEGLKTLSRLKTFNIYGNEIGKLKNLDYLSSLTHLNLFNNKIEKIENLTDLTSLKFLRLAKNKIQKINNLDFLKRLKYLDLHYNSIQEINGLDNLSQLTELDLRANQISGIKNLTGLLKLKRFDLRNNIIADVEPLIPLLTKAENPLSIILSDSFTDEDKFEINLFDNPLTSPTVEIALQGNEAILNYFSELEKQGTEYLYEAKMLIVGQPRAGKTSLRDKLFDINAQLPNEDKTTRGIDIKRLDFNIIDINGKPRIFYYNLWDFGGQHIYQTTHQFFLTHRSLYVLVIDTGKDSIGNDDTTINYWLQAVELLGGNSPMLLVRNEKNERQVNIDLPQKRARFEFLKGDYSVDLNALITGTPEFSGKRFNEFNHLKEDIQTELKRLPLVGFPMPKNWATIRKQLQVLSENKHYISRHEFIELCNKNDVKGFERQMELSRIFHDLGVFLHFQDYVALEDFIILQNTWATDAVFAVFDAKKVQTSEGRFSTSDLGEIWKEKDYEPSVHRKLLELMMQFELCYLVDKSSPNVYIIPEMLADSQIEGTPWKAADDLPLQYNYDFMPRGILTRFVVRMHKNVALHKGQQIVWKTGVRIDGNTLDCPQSHAEITEAWDNKKLDIKVQGPFAKNLITIISSRIDELNNEFFRQVSVKNNTQKSKWYKMIPCNCATCKNIVAKHFYDYRKLLERRTFGKKTIECENAPYEDVNITELLEGVFSDTEKGKKIIRVDKIAVESIKIFLASSSELENERKEFRLFIGEENQRLNKMRFNIELTVWEDFLDQMSQTRLQDEYNQAIKSCDIFVMLYFTKVGKYTAEEFETAFKTFKETNKPKIYTYFKKGDIKSTDENREGKKSLWAFQDKLKELGHYQTEFESDAQLHLHFKKQLERIYDL